MPKATPKGKVYFSIVVVKKLKNTAPMVTAIRMLSIAVTIGFGIALTFMGALSE
jgi:hypothetical protein